MILGEFAVNPAVINDWNDLKILTMNFGFHNGAVISAFPLSWIEDLKLKATKELFGTKEFLIVTERLNLLKKEYFVKCNRGYKYNASWIDNAVQEHLDNPFYKLINDEKHDRVIVFNDIDEKVFDELRDGYCQRHAVTLADEARLLLECSKNIKVIDPFFGKHRGYKKTLKEIINITIIKTGRSNVCIEVHASSKQGGTDVNINQVKMVLEKEYPSIIPKGLVLKVFWWNDPDTNELHPRYLISEKSGIRYDRGFLEPNELTEKNSETDVSMMISTKVNKIWNKFTPESSNYLVVDQLEIKGNM